MEVRSVRYPLFALTMALMAPSPGVGQAAREGEEEAAAVSLVKARCLFCHGAVTMLGFSQRMLDAGGPEALDIFLAGHHAPDAEARRAIVQFLSRSIPAPR